MKIWITDVSGTPFSAHAESTWTIEGLTGFVDSTSILS
jgi:hypothetical protein